MSNDHLQAALKYHSLGYQVIPLCTPDLEHGGCIQHGRDCSHPGKVPLVKWKERTKIMRQELRQWWRRWPKANLGALIGNGLVVVDVDPRNGGWETVTELGIKSPDTVTDLTGGGGEHWFFRDKSGICSKLLGPGLELLAEGKIVVLPPSLHASGRRYQWETGYAPNERSPEPVPTWLLDIAGRPSRKRETVHRDGAHNGNGEFDAGPAAPAPLRESLTQRLLAMGGKYQPDGRILASCTFPEHQDSGPSFYYSPHTGRWWCFGAGHPGRKPGKVCAGGNAHQLEGALFRAAAGEMLISVIREALPRADYRNGQPLSLEHVEGVYHRMINALQSKLKSNEWHSFKEMETMNAIGETLETALEGFLTDRKPGGIRIPCLKNGVQEHIHVFPQGCGNPLCPVHSTAKAEENLRPKWKRLKIIEEPALVMFRSLKEGPRQVATRLRKLERRKGYPLKRRGWYKLVLPCRPGAQVGILIDLASENIDLEGLKGLWGEEVALVRLPKEHLYELLREFIRQVDYPEAYSSDESYWLDWLLQTRGLQCARPMGAARINAGEIEEEEPGHCPHGNVYGKPLGMLTPAQMKMGLSDGYLEETPFGLLEVKRVPPDTWQDPPGIHKWKDMAIMRRRQKEEAGYPAG